MGARHVPARRLTSPRWLLPGDPGRVARIAEVLDVREEVRQSREFAIVEGTYKGVPVGVCSTGIGSPSTAIAVEELATLGAEVMIRVGTCGALTNTIPVGALCIAEGAIRREGTSSQYVSHGVPAVPSPEVFAALCRAAPDAYHGFAVSNDAFYRESPSWAAEMAECGGTHVEMEAAALFVVARMRGVRAGSVCAVTDNLITEAEAFGAGLTQAILTALDACLEL